MLKVQGYPTAFFWKQAKALDVPLLPSSTTAHRECFHPLCQSRSHFSIIMAWHFVPSAPFCVTHHQGTTGTPPHAKAMACSAENFSFHSAGSTRLPQRYQGPREESQGAAGHLVRCFNTLSSSEKLLVTSLRWWQHVLHCGCTVQPERKGIYLHGASVTVIQWKQNYTC